MTEAAEPTNDNAHDLSEPRQDDTCSDSNSKSDLPSENCGSDYAENCDYEKSQTTSSADAVAKSQLFKLPPELRNLIYRYTLVEERVSPRSRETIHVTNAAGIPEPDLLFVCKIIRSEAITIFYLENKFCIDMADWNPGAYQLFHRKKDLLGMTDNNRPHQSVKGPFTRNWPSSKKWVCLNRHGKTGCVTSLWGNKVEFHLTRSMFSLAHYSRDLSDEWFSELIESMRPAFIALNSEWKRN